MGRRIIIGGDIFPRSDYQAFAKGDLDALYAKEIQDLFKNADFSICNLEGALTDNDIKILKCGPSIKAPPETIAGIKALGIDCLSLANNHVIDYGDKGYQDTCDTLKDQNIAFFGAGSNIHTIETNFQVDIGGKKVVFYAVGETVFNIPSESSAGINLYDEYRVCNEIKTLKAQCDYLIVLYHGGVEYFQYPTAWVRTRFHRMADCGADMVIAQHTHCIGTQENYNGSFLLYGQGNFHFIQHNETSVTQTGLLLEAELKDAGIEIKHHLVFMDGDMAKYSQEQDLSEFYDRNKRLAAGDTFEKEFSAYSEKWMLKWLAEFRGQNIMDKIMRRLVSKEKYVRYLRKNYSDHTVLRMLEHVRGEEDVEVMQRGLLDFFEM